MAHIEAQTMISMIKSEILPAVSKYNHKLAKTLAVKNNLNLNLSSDYEYKALKKLSKLSDILYEAVGKLDKTETLCSETESMTECAKIYRDTVLGQMSNVRKIVDEIETEMPKEYWPYPSYEDILFSV